MNSGKTKYQKLSGILRRKILDGEYNASGHLEPEEALAALFGMSRHTVRQAIALLENEGLVSRRQGSGTYINRPQVMKLTTQSQTVAVISTYIEGHIFPFMIKGISDVLNKNGLTMTLHATNNQVARERAILEACLAQNPLGIIVDATKSNLPNPNISLYREFSERNIPIVFMNGYYPELAEQTVHVVVDDEAGGYMAADYLARKEHTKIAGIFKSDDMQGPRRYGGYVKCLLDKKLAFNDDWVFWYSDPVRMDHAVRQPASFIEFLMRHTAVICYNDEIAIKIMQLLERHNVRVPGDIAVVSFDNSPYSDITPVKLTTLNHPKNDLGQLAGQKMLNMIAGVQEQSAVMDWEMVVRESG